MAAADAALGPLLAPILERGGARARRRHLRPRRVARRARRGDPRPLRLRGDPARAARPVRARDPRARGRAHAGAARRRAADRARRARSRRPCRPPGPQPARRRARGGPRRAGQLRRGAERLAQPRVGAAARSRRPAASSTSTCRCRSCTTCARTPPSERTSPPRAPQDLERLRARLGRLREGEAGVGGARRGGARRRASALRALGYVAGGPRARKERYGDEDDPKRLVALDAAGERGGHALRGAATYEGAVALCQRARRSSARTCRSPGSSSRTCERARGRLDEAIAAAQRALALQARSTRESASLLGAYLTEAGRARGGGGAPRAVRAPLDRPTSTCSRRSGWPRRGVGPRRTRRSRRSRRARDARPVERARPRRTSGTVHLMAGDRAAARQAFEAALDLDDDLARAHNGLGVIAAAGGAHATRRSRAGSARRRSTRATTRRSSTSAPRCATAGRDGGGAPLPRGVPARGAGGARGARHGARPRPGSAAGRRREAAAEGSGPRAGVAAAAPRRRAVAPPRRPRDLGPGGVSVVLVSVDTLRADRLPVYGYAKGETPHLDAPRPRGRRVRGRLQPLPADAARPTPRCSPASCRRATASATTPATRSARRRAHAGRALPRDRVSRPEPRCRRSSCAPRRGSPRASTATTTRSSATPRSRTSGSSSATARVAVSSLLDWIEAQGGRRFFAFLHLYEPHAPYAPPSPFRERFAASPYDGEVAYADALVGRFLDGLRERALLDRTVVAFVSDHGEALGDHGEREHGFFLYRETVRVPLVVRLPGAARRRTGALRGRSASSTSRRRSWTSRGCPRTDSTASRFAPRSQGARAPTGRPVYSETWLPRLSLRLERAHGRERGAASATCGRRGRSSTTSRPIPARRRNLAAERPQAVAAIGAWLRERARGRRAPARGGRPGHARAARRPRLRREAPRRRRGASAGRWPTRRTRSGVYEGYRRALALRRDGRDAEAVVRVAGCARRQPGHGRRMAGPRPHARPHGPGEGGARRARSCGPPRARPRVDPPRDRARPRARRPRGAGAGARPRRGDERAGRRPRDRGAAPAVPRPLRRGRGRGAQEPRRRPRAAGEPVRARRRRAAGGPVRGGGRGVPARRRRPSACQKRLVVPGLHAGLGDCLARLGRERRGRGGVPRRDRRRCRRAARDASASRRCCRSQGRDDEARAALEALASASARPAAEDYFAVARTYQVLGDAAAARRWAAVGHSRFPADPRFR